jgi:exodeoxyribonuclease III
MDGGWAGGWMVDGRAASTDHARPLSPTTLSLRTNPLYIKIKGRALAVELPRFWLATVYVPNSGEGLRRLGFRTDPGGWDDALAAWVGRLSASSGGKPVILCGDLNCAREPVDIYAPATHLRAAGFTIEERESFADRLLGRAGLADCLRARIPPDQPAYTYFSYRAGNLAKNRGWRLDYFLAPSAFDRDEVADAWQLPHVRGSDHVPVGLAVRGGAGE